MAPRIMMREDPEVPDLVAASLRADGVQVLTGHQAVRDTAAHQAWTAAVNALFGRFRSFKADYRVIPWATFTDPEVARVGLSETEAKEQGIAFELTRCGVDDLGRPACLRPKVRTSCRRWELRGVWRTIFLMWRLRWRYWRSESAARLAEAYR